MLGLMAGMDQKDSYAARYRPRSSPIPAVACAWLVLLVLCFDKVVDVPVVRVLQLFQVQVVEVIFEIPQLLLVEKIVVMGFSQTSESLGTAPDC